MRTTSEKLCPWCEGDNRQRHNLPPCVACLSVALAIVEASRARSPIATRGATKDRQLYCSERPTQ
jgi:hypothetical protein